MYGACDAKRGRDRVGGVLFEVMLSIALFVGAAAFTLASVRNVTRSLERARLLEEAVDVARSRMAELEAGLTTLAGVRGETDVDAGYGVEQGPFTRDNAPISQLPPRWRIDVATSRTTLTNLTLVELTVTQNLTPEEESAGANPMRYTLRQLVELRESAGDGFEEDPMLRGLGVQGGAAR